MEEATAPAAGLAEAAAVLAAAAGGGISCQALDAGLGTKWGRELLPDLTYLLMVDRAGAIKSQASTHPHSHCSTRLLRAHILFCACSTN